MWLGEVGCQRGKVEAWRRLALVREQLQLIGKRMTRLALCRGLDAALGCGYL